MRISHIPRGTSYSRIGNQSQFPAGTPQQGEVVEAQGKFLVPGFLDMHTHVLQQEEHVVEASSALLLAHGVTGIRQMAGSTEMLRMRRAGTLSLGEHAPELLTLCGEILTPMNAATPEATSVLPLHNQSHICEALLIKRLSSVRQRTFSQEALLLKVVDPHLWQTQSAG